MVIGVTVTKLSSVIKAIQAQNELVGQSLADLQVVLKLLDVKGEVSIPLDVESLGPSRQGKVSCFLLGVKRTSKGKKRAR